MQDLDAMIRVVLLAPEDDTARLACADAFEEAGQAEHAAFIRWQLAGGKGKILGWSRDWLPAGLREKSWVVSGNDHFLHLGTGGTRSYRSAGVCEVFYRRGFVERVSFPTFKEFEEHARGLFATNPIQAAYLEDRSPDATPLGHSWAMPRAGLARKNPWVVPLKLRDWPGWESAHSGSNKGWWRSYCWQSEAVRALSNALVWYGRTLAGLPV
jgi:uncharacterized protein (TIGR02996 family)